MVPFPLPLTLFTVLDSMYDKCGRLHHAAMAVADIASSAVVNSASHSSLRLVQRSHGDPFLLWVAL